MSQGCRTAGEVDRRKRQREMTASPQWQIRGPCLVGQDGVAGLLIQYSSSVLSPLTNDFILSGFSINKLNTLLS